jgi:hypothetical protein
MQSEKLMSGHQFVKWPYTSVVSKRVTPHSTTARITAIIHCLSPGEGEAKAHSMQPTPLAYTNR